jgi:hypothetical protein
LGDRSKIAATDGTDFTDSLEQKETKKSRFGIGTSLRSFASVVLFYCGAADGVFFIREIREIRGGPVLVATGRAAPSLSAKASSATTDAPFCGKTSELPFHERLAHE